MLAEGGFILVNDYGQTQITRDDEFEHQRFSLATFVGVNFSLLRAYFGEGKRCQYLEPGDEEGRGIHARLLAPTVAQDVFVRFHERFGAAAHQRLQEPIQKARTCTKAGRFELAAGFYRDALQLQPRNWVLLCEVSQFLTFSLREPKRGADMAKVALALNPSCSAELWNALGDALYEWGRTGEARSAYEKALAVNAADVRARYNLAWVHAREREYPQALARIAEALALDKTGEYRDRLLQKQQEVVALQAPAPAGIFVADQFGEQIREAREGTRESGMSPGRDGRASPWGTSLPSLRDSNLFSCLVNPGLTSWATIFRPCRDWEKAVPTGTQKRTMSHHGQQHAVHRIAAGVDFDPRAVLRDAGIHANLRAERPAPQPGAVRADLSRHRLPRRHRGIPGRAARRVGEPAARRDLPGGDRPGHFDGVEPAQQLDLMRLVAARHQHRVLLRHGRLRPARRRRPPRRPWTVKGPKQHSTERPPDCSAGRPVLGESPLHMKSIHLLRQAGPAGRYQRL